METACTSNGRTLQFENGATSNGQVPLYENDNIFIKETLLDGNGATSNEKTLPFRQKTSSSDKKPRIYSYERTFARETNELSVEEVVQALCSAWKKTGQPKRKLTLEFFTDKDLYAMHLAWKNVAKGRRCFSQPHLIAQAVATSITKELLSIPRCYENDTGVDFETRFATYESVLTANLLNAWEDVTEGTGLCVRYVQTILGKSGEQPLVKSEFQLRLIELYDKIRDFIINPKLQIFIQVLLFFWPITILIIGSKYVECSMGHHLSPLLLLLGCIGCLTILFRLVLMYLTSQFQNPANWVFKWIYLKLVEFTFLIVFIVQAFHFFDTDPTSEPDPNKCVQNFYNDALVINYVSVALVLANLLAYFLSIYHRWLDVGHWVFRYI